MPHIDEETLAALALGEPVGADEAAHVTACERCAAELEALRALQSTLIDAGAVGPLMQPGSHVWDAIAREIAEDEGRTRDDDFDGGVLLQLDERRTRRGRREPSRLVYPWVVGAAAAAGVVVGGVGVAFLTLDSEPELAVVAQAELADLATEEPAGTARVEQRSDGSEVLVLDTTYAAGQEGSLEVWLIDPDVVGMVSLGFLTGSHAEFDIPEGYTVDAFPIVDISVEPADGDPTHSGDSITRGILES